MVSDVIYKGKKEVWQRLQLLNFVIENRNFCLQTKEKIVSFSRISLVLPPISVLPREALLISCINKVTLPYELMP